MAPRWGIWWKSSKDFGAYTAKLLSSSQVRGWRAHGGMANQGAPHNPAKAARLAEGQTRWLILVTRSLPIVLPEVAQIRWRLVLLGGHQQAVAAEVIDLLADADVNVALAADLMAEPDRSLGLHAPVRLVDDPRPRQRVICRGDVVMEQVRIGFVEIDSLVDDGFIVGVQRDAGSVINARALQAPGLDHERVVAA